MLNRNALDRYITGNYGDNQFPDDEPPCLHASRVDLGVDPDGYPVFQCRGCGDLFDEPGRECTERMRTGHCVLDTGHRGRHSTVGFYCDACGKTRRSRPVGREINPFDDTVEAEFCFMCQTVGVAY